jgi:hypothetical protein
MYTRYGPVYIALAVVHRYKTESHGIKPISVVVLPPQYEV